MGMHASRGIVAVNIVGQRAGNEDDAPPGCLSLRQRQSRRKLTSLCLKHEPLFCIGLLHSLLLSFQCALRNSRTRAMYGSKATRRIRWPVCSKYTILILGCSDAP